MDSQIYMLLAQAEQLKSVEYVEKAYKILNPDKKSTDDDKSGNDIENFSQSLFVECAEKALSFNENEIANHCIQIYFSLPMIANQFLARAYICQFELLAPKGTKQIENLEKSIPFLFKAIDFSKENKRYNFLVYNASIIFWKYARNFAKKNFRHYLITSLKKITDSLKEINDNDYEWRVFLEKTLIDAYLDKANSKEAINVAANLFIFIEKKLPTMFDEFFEFMIQKQLINDEEAVQISNSKWDLEAIYRIEKLKMHEKPLLRKPVNITPLNTLVTSTSQLAMKDTSSDDIVLNELNEIYKIILPPNKIHNTDSQLASHRKKTEPTKREDVMITLKRQRLLLNLAHVSLMFEEVNFCSQIIGYLKETDLVNAEEFSLELEFIECELMVRELNYKQEKYTKSVVKIRVDSINKLHELLRNAQRLNNPRLIQLGCMMQWNLCLPLLQPGLRKNARKALQLCSECLESIDSMEWLLRSQIHFELAKCDEEIEQLQTAEQHLLKSCYFDDAGIYREQLNHSLKRLRLRAELYKTPDHVEDQVAMILEQCVVGGKTEKRLKPAIDELLTNLNKNNTQAFSGEINTHSLLLRAADLLAPNEFTHVLESETFKSFGKLNEDKISKLAKKALNYETSISKCTEHLNHRLIDVERIHLKEKLSNSKLENILNEDYKERLKLWFDLCRISRKQQLWDLCRVSARFCLLYDDEKLIKRFLTEKNETKSPEKEKSLVQPEINRTTDNKFVPIMQSTTQVQFGSLFDRELMRNLAEANFIMGESLIQFIRNEGIELFDKPKIPDMSDSTIKTIIKKNSDGDPVSSKHEIAKRNFSTDKEWLDYCEWLNKMCYTAMRHFLRGVQIGIQLNESWIVCQGSTYAWNYMHHIFDQKRFSQVTNILSELVIALQKVGHNTEPELLVALSVAQAKGLMQNWLPREQVKRMQVPSVSDLGNSDKDLKKKEKTMDKSNVSSKVFTIPSEAVNDFKKALDVCEYAMQVTNGENLIDVISLKDRFPLIKTWVLAKQMNQSQIKNISFSKNSQQTEKIQDKFTKCMVGVEMHNRNLKMSGQPSFELKEIPSIRDIIGLIDWADKWPDKLVELELWANLAVLASKYGQTDNLRQCHSKALESISYFEKKKAENKTIYLTSQMLLSETCIALGEHLASLLYSPSSAATEKKEKSILSGKQRENSEKSSSTMSKDMLVALRRDALNAFADAAGYAARAENYENAIHSARHYWNLCMPYLQSNFERATLFDNLREILLSLQIVYKFKPPDLTPESIEKEDVQSTDVAETKTEADKGDKKAGAPAAGKETATGTVAKKADSKLAGKGSAKTRDPDATATAIGGATTEAANESPRSIVGPSDAIKALSDDAFDDLTLRCVLYACMFQILIDKRDYEEALEQMEIALNDLPRTKHRLLIYRLKVITKSKLGLDVQMDLQKFREESEKNLAQMYRKVALESIKHVDTINSYQRAIEALSSEDSVWLKIEYILELAQWLYSHEYHLNDCIDLCEWAIDLLMFNIRPQIVTARPTTASTVFSVVVSKPAPPQARRTSKIQPNPGAQFSAILPTIQDEGSILDHSQIYHNVDTAFKSIELDAKLESSSKENLFELMNTKVMNWNDFQDIKQLECLMRSHVILAVMVQSSSPDYTGYLLKAYYSLVRLISLATENALSSNKELANTNTKLQSEATDKKGKDAGSKKANSTEPRSNTNTKVKENKQGSPGTSSALPQSLEQWSLYDLSEEVMTAWSQDSMKRTGINQHTIVEPNLTFYYLELLAKMLAKLGYNHLLFPVYNLQLIIVNCLLKNELESVNQVQSVTMYAYIRLRLINLCIELNLINSVTFHQQALASFVQSVSKLKADPTDPNLINQTINTNPSILLKLVQMDPIEAVYVREQIYNQKQRMSQIEAEEEASLNTNSTYSLGSVSRKLNNEHPSTKVKKKNRAKSTKFDEGKGKSTGVNIAEDLNLPGEQRKIYSNLLEILYKDVWLLMAETLIQNGFFQTARDYLYESLNASTSFEDKHTKAKIQLLLGQIALFDCNFIEAKSYAATAQKMAIDEMFWFKAILLLVDAHFQDREDKEANDKCIQILNKSLNLVRVEKHRRLNKRTKFEYIEALLNYKLAQIVSDGILNGKLKESADLSSRQSKTGRRSVKRNSMHPNLFKKLSEVCNMFQKSIELLIKNGFLRETLPIFKSHAKLLQRFAADCHNQEAKMDYMLQIYSILTDACNIANEIWIEVESLQLINDTSNLSLPIQREMVDLKLEIAQLLTDMLELNLNEIINTNEKNMNKNAIHKVVENFITLNENLTKTEKEWQIMSAQIPDLIFSTLVSCHSLTLKLKHFRGQILYLIGRTFRLFAEIKYQMKNCDSYEKTDYLQITSTLSKWTPAIMDLIREKYQQIVDQIEASKSKAKTTKSTINVTSAQTEVSENTENDYGANLDHLAPVFENSNLTNLLEQEQLKNLLISVNQIEAQGMECLLQALNIAFTIEDKLLIRNISYELIEIVGRYDLSLCSQFIALYQSCSNALEIEHIVEKSSLDPKNSLLVSYLHQMKFYQKMNITCNVLNSPIVKQILDGTKSKFNALKYLTVNSNHFNMCKDLPANCLVIIIQHNHSRTELFGTVLNTSKEVPQATNAKSSQAQFIASSLANLKASSIKIKTHPFELYHLQQQWKEWKTNLQAFNLKIEFQLSNDLITKKSQNEFFNEHEDLSELMKIYLNSGSPKFEEMIRQMTELDNKFEYLMNKTEAYLQPMTDFFQTVLSSNEFQSQSPKPNTKLVLLSDLDLFEFPLESLKIFYNNISITAITRDFSLQFFSTRYTMNKEVEASQAADMKLNPPKAAKTEKKNTQAVVSEPLPEGSVVVDSGRFKYLVDVYQESSLNLPAEYTPINTFKKIHQAYPQISTRWSGITGADHIAGLGECERLLAESSCFMFHGTERFLSYFNSSKISSINLDCRLVISNDLAQTSKSFSRLGKLDVLRNAEEIECENPLETCILLSLSGVKSIISNQWASTLAENSDKLFNLFKEFVESRQSCGEIIRYRVSPHLKLILNNENTKKEEEAATAAVNKAGTESKLKDKKTSALRADTTTTKKSEKTQLNQSIAVSNQVGAEDAAKKAEEDKLQEEKLKKEEEEKRNEMIKKAQILRKEKSNMVLYGLPDIYLIN